MPRLIGSFYNFAVLSFFLAIILALPALAQEDRFATKDYQLSVKTIVSGLEHPWGLAKLPNGDFLVTERGGLLWLIRDGKKIGTVKGLPQIVAAGQGGLLDVVIDPEFEKNKTIYFSFTQGDETGLGTAIAAGELSIEPELQLLNSRVIFSMAKKSGGVRHFGSRLAFANDGSLFFTIGDRGEKDRAQDVFDHAGSVLRIMKNGKIPSNNPAADGKRGLAEIWSKGHRNAQGAAIHPTTGELWIVEHGAQGGDEINLIAPKKNYGWPIISYGKHYSGLKIGEGTKKKGYEQPKYYWDPSIAPSGLAFYWGELFPKWKGDLFVGALKDRKLVRLDFENGEIIGEEILLEQAYGRIRDVRVFDDGAIWLLTDEENGKILKITPAK